MTLLKILVFGPVVIVGVVLAFTLLGPIVGVMALTVAWIAARASTASKRRHDDLVRELRAVRRAVARRK